MDESGFWRLIEKARNAGHGELEGVIESLAGALNTLPIDDVVDFDRHVWQLMARSYTWELWGAAYVIGGGCSDDGFDYFREWLILQGKVAFERALADADSLADVAEEEAECEGLLSLASGTYEERTGKAVPPHGVAYPKEPTGADWEEEDLPKRYPRLTKKFGSA